jgi:hypothetical protein
MRMSRYACWRHGDEPAPWPEWVPAGQRRRQDPLTRQACAAVDLLLGRDERLPAATAVVVSTSYGAVDSTLRFVSGIAEFGDAGASPTPFTTSVHNSCAGALGEMLGLHGPSTTLSQGSTGGIAALRWAMLMLEAGRAPAVLVVVADRHNQWSHDMVAALSGSRWPVSDGAAAALIEAGTGPGRELRLGRHAALQVLDGGAQLADDELLLAERAAGMTRTIAPALLAGWWPCCLLAALPWRQEGALQLREVEAGLCCEAWLGPHQGDQPDRSAAASGAPSSGP